ncbi:D-arabinono-1,4-lactone oxidase [Chitinispirillales bacterium ANBcel5]|uniref:D-arabinono-1,4-lactone oxidase n=1 Tax=Cellulosispirillum alkaliphilum TaxID=3039283 RepID=UPI002A51098F|nr:D-arabinono-1,4-lactone oxidase [Chitinispirillales bacterium ANBcel5]
MQHQWKNWSGTIHFTPGSYVAPKEEEQVAEIVASAARRGLGVRPLGRGHSSSPLVQTDGVLLSLKNFSGISSFDLDNSEVWLGAGTVLSKAGRDLLEIGFSMENYGDVAYQSAAGAFGTGTHGSGVHLKNLSYHLTGVRFIDSRGEIIQVEEQSNPEFFKAARVSLGTLGIFTSVRLKVIPAFRAVRRYWCTHVDDCLEHIEELQNNNRSFDFYWYPRSDLVQIRTLNLVNEDKNEATGSSQLRKEKYGYATDIIPHERTLKYHEMEFAYPLKMGPLVFRRIRNRVKKIHRKDVCWRVLYRTVAGDDTFLSNCYGQDTVAITIHQNVTLPYEQYFADMEPLFVSLGGRPHWAKKHSLQSESLKERYPMWDDFLAVRKKWDPEGVFLNSYLRQLFGLKS